tara:strand:- start:11828 stop:12244 length:417 start_codon:yes stop_codon:yes gene_type:complete
MKKRIMENIDGQEVVKMVDVTEKKVKKIKVQWNFTEPFSFDMEGFTDGTYWNGWANIWVTKNVYQSIIKKWSYESIDEDFLNLKPCSKGEFKGLYHLEGYTVDIIEDDCYGCFSQRHICEHDFVINDDARIMNDSNDN